MSPNRICPKCGHPLGSGVTRCWIKGCDYVIPGTLVLHRTTLTTIDDVRKKLRELEGYWAETSEQKKAVGRVVTLTHSPSGKREGERTKIVFLLRGATDHVLRKQSWLVHDLQIRVYNSMTHFVEEGVIDVQFAGIAMTVNEYRRQPGQP